MAPKFVCDAIRDSGIFRFTGDVIKQKRFPACFAREDLQAIRRDIEMQTVVLRGTRPKDMAPQRFPNLVRTEQLRFNLVCASGSGEHDDPVGNDALALFIRRMRQSPDRLRQHRRRHASDGDKGRLSLGTGDLRGRR